LVADESHTDTKADEKPAKNESKPATSPSATKIESPAPLS
jgi:hypothetical protein